MPERSKISDISRKLKEEHQLTVSPIELNLMLISTGDIVQTAVGKVETKQGREHGIIGEYRTPDNRAPYWIPLYSEAAVSYVEELALSVFVERLPPEVPTIEPMIQHCDTVSGNTSNIVPAHMPAVQSAATAAAGGNAQGQEPLTVHSCMNCRLYRNEDCGIPSGLCSFYEPCYIPTAQDIESWISAQQGFGVVGSMLTQNALGIEHT